MQCAGEPEKSMTANRYTAHLTFQVERRNKAAACWIVHTWVHTARNLGKQGVVERTVIGMRKFKEAYPSFGRLKRKYRPLNVKKSAKGNLVHLSNLRLGLKLILVRGCENVAGRRGKQQQE